MADVLLALGSFAALVAGLALFSRWVADTITGWLDRSVRSDFWSDHPVWREGNGA